MDIDDARIRRFRAERENALATVKSIEVDGCTYSEAFGQAPLRDVTEARLRALKAKVDMLDKVIRPIEIEKSRVAA